MLTPYIGMRSGGLGFVFDEKACLSENFDWGGFYVKLWRISSSERQCPRLNKIYQEQDLVL